MSSKTVALLDFLKPPQGINKNKMGISPSLNRIYRPTFNQWLKIIEGTEIDPYCHHSKVELINFKTSKIHLKGGARLSFDCLSESQYIHVINGGYYEDAPTINETDRV